MTEKMSANRSEACVAVMAHNEERNIQALLERVSMEQAPGIEISRIVVVSSGSTDKTDETVRAAAKTNPRIKLITQSRRHGKCAAINLFLKEYPACSFVVLLSGDVLPEPGAVGKLLEPLLDKEVGMTGGRPVPVNEKNTFFGFACHLIWSVHHQIALVNPKLGEAVAFKSIVESIPEDLAVDEAAIEAAIRQKGLKLRYCPDAVIRNRGPDNLHDFLKQRRRIQAGHLHLLQKTAYKVSTSGSVSALKALMSIMSWKPKFIFWTFLTCLLVSTGRVLGTFDHYLRGRHHAVWDIAESTKGDLSEKATTKG